MTILFMDSVQYLDTTYLRKRWSYGDPQIDTGVYRHGSRSVYCSAGYDSGFPFPLTTGVYLGCSVYVDVVLATGSWYDPIVGLAYNNTSGCHCHINFTVDGAVRAYANWNSTPIQTTANGLIGAYSWHYIEIYCYSDVSAGVMKVWVDDALVIDQSGLDTVVGTQGNQLGIFGAASGGHWTANFQDIYVSTDRLGPCKVSAYDVDSDGNYTQWSPLGAGSHYVEVDDATPDGDTSYNDGDAVGEKDSYGVTAESLDTIHALQVRSIAKRSEDITIGKFRHFIRQSAADYVASQIHTVVGSYSNYVDIWESDPSDSNPWTQAKIESAEFGVEVTQLGTTTTTT